MELTAHVPDWAAELYKPYRYKALYGGRASGKTWAISQALVIQALTRPGLRVACVREHQRSISESAKRTLEMWIHRLGVIDHFTILSNTIQTPGGGVIIFRGMSTATQESLRGLEGIDVCWVEEAQRMTHRSREILFPTIRKPGSEIWLSFNPQSRGDPAYREFVANPRDGAFTRLINYMDNRWFPPEAEQERLATLRDEPDRYPHVWLGQPDDESGERKVLPYALLQRCVDAWHLRPRDGVGAIHAGLDIADTGADRNALVARRGPVLYHAERWSETGLDKTALRADLWCRENGAAILHYDAGGIGAPIRTFLAQLGSTGYAHRPISFGGKVGGEKREFSRNMTNADFFARRNAQMGWALRLRGQITRRLLEGEGVPTDRCLFIDPAIPRLEDYLAQLTQPAWKEDVSGKVVIDKQPRDPGQAEPPSPDLYDATVLAFAHDSRLGLRARL